MRLSLSRALSLSLALAAGCAPGLGGDGYYACAREQRCPAAWPVCGADGLCHASAGDAGASDAPAIDTNAAPLSYAACNGDVPGTCGTDVCYFDAFPGFPHDGYCTRGCVSDGECPAFGGAPSACVASRCMRGCASSTSCPDSLACAAGRWRDDASLRLCVTLDEAVPGSYDVCSTDTECARPMSCVNGACLRPCATTADCILDFEECVTDAAGGRACLETCIDASECSGIGDLCTLGTCRPSASW